MNKVEISTLNFGQRVTLYISIDKEGELLTTTTKINATFIGLKRYKEREDQIVGQFALDIPFRSEEYQSAHYSGQAKENAQKLRLSVERPTLWETDYFFPEETTICHIER